MSATSIGSQYTEYRTYVEGSLKYTGPDLEKAVRTWDRETHALGQSVPGGIAVATYEHTSYEPGLLQLRDGWVLHVREDGTVYLNPNITEAKP